MKSNPRYVVRRSRTPEPVFWIIDQEDRFGDIECRTRQEARDKCNEMNKTNATGTKMLAAARGQT